MVNHKIPYSLYFPVTLGETKLFVFVDENLRAEKEQCTVIPHCHHFYELKYIEAGVLVQEIDGVTHLLHPKDFVLIRPGEYHCQELDPTHPNVLQYSLRFELAKRSPNCSANEGKAFQTLNDLLSVTRCVKDRSGVLSHMFKRLMYEISHKEDGYVHNMQMLTSLILTEFIRLSKQNIKPLFPSEDMKYSGFMITKLETFFSRKCYLHNIKIEDLAAEINFSPRHTARILRQIYGMTFSEKLTEVRVRRAAYRLINSDVKIEEISTGCGFNSTAYFHTCFKKIHGMTPSEFRQKATLNEEDTAYAERDNP